MNVKTKISEPLVCFHFDGMLAGPIDGHSRAERFMGFGVGGSGGVVLNLYSESLPNSTQSHDHHGRTLRSESSPLFRQPGKHVVLRTTLELKYHHMIQIRQNGSLSISAS